MIDFNRTTDNKFGQIDIDTCTRILDKANKFKPDLFVFVYQRKQNDVGEISFIIDYNILYIKTISSLH